MTAPVPGNPHGNFHNTAEIEVDHEDNFSDIASTIGSDGEDFCSLSESVRRHVYENGRRYHSKWEGRYILPNDETEQNRLDFLHAIRKQLQGDNLQLANLPAQIHNVLDCGTGTGIWAVEFAEEHPEAQVIGVDLTAIQPDWVPPNCVFEVDDLEQPWLWKEKFDFIHSSDLSQGIRDWKTYIQRIFKHLRPGGVAELTEGRPGFRSDDDSVPKGGYLEKYTNLFFEACAKVGLRDASPDFPRLMEEAGFTDVRCVFKKLPVGYWPRDPHMKALGGWGMAESSDAMNCYGLALFTRELGMTQAEAEELATKAFKECVQKGVHAYVQFVYVTGKKPE